MFDFGSLVGTSEMEMFCKTLQTGWKGETEAETLLEQQPMSCLHCCTLSRTILVLQPSHPSGFCSCYKTKGNLVKL